MHFHPSWLAIRAAIPFLVALFMHNMLIRPTEEELDNFGRPDFTILNAGEFPANRYTHGMTSSTSVAINFRRKEMGTPLLCLAKGDSGVIYTLRTGSFYFGCSDSWNTVCG